MSHAQRLAQGGLIDRESRIGFSFNGKHYRGLAGDSLASALLANGVTLTARSFKYHRPRGIVGAGHEEPASLVELVGDEASGNQPITRVILRDGLEARSVNCWPSPDFDLMAVNQWFAKLIPAAFYYKTFKWPDWHLFEPSIRRAAGLAAAPDRLLHDGHYETRYAHCDVLIVGAGPAGLNAALTPRSAASGSCSPTTASNPVAACFRPGSQSMARMRSTGCGGRPPSSMHYRMSHGSARPRCGLTVNITC